MTEQNSNTMTSWISRVLAWVKKWWFLFLVIPAVLIVLDKLGGFIEKLFMKPNKPDLMGDDMNHANDMSKLTDEERKKLEEADKEAGKIKNGIDAGSPTPADVFDKEINK